MSAGVHHATMPLLALTAKTGGVVLRNSDSADDPSGTSSNVFVTK